MIEFSVSWAVDVVVFIYMLYLKYGLSSNLNNLNLLTAACFLIHSNISLLYLPDILATLSTLVHTFPVTSHYPSPLVFLQEIIHLRLLRKIGQQFSRWFHFWM